nr:helix-turn-helix transcriptional regulator [Eggerthella hominis]
MLSKREVEVLTLYALGHTQAHISEELSVASTTVRTHIRNIYQKTDLHSRQDILNYMAEYVRK